MTPHTYRLVRVGQGGKTHVDIGRRDGVVLCDAYASLDKDPAQRTPSTLRPVGTGRPTCELCQTLLDKPEAEAARSLTDDERAERHRARGGGRLNLADLDSSLRGHPRR
jgi:hypothetical protein